MSDGALVVRNDLAYPVVLQSVQPVFLSGPRTDKTEQLGTYVIALGDDEEDTGRGIERTFPPAATPGEARHPVAGFALDPGRRAALVMGFQVRTGMAILVAARVDFTLSGQAHTQLIDHKVLICEGRPAGTSSCPAPPHI